MLDRGHVAKIVSAYAKRNVLAADQLPTLIATVHSALARVEAGGLPEPPPPMKLVPAVPIRRSVQPEAITCLDCGYRGLMIKQHLRTAHQTTPGEYRERWGLKRDYPIVAPNYTAPPGTCQIIWAWAQTLAERPAISWTCERHPRDGAARCSRSAPRPVFALTVSDVTPISHPAITRVRG